MNPRIILGGLIPFITSPVGLAVVGVGALGYTLYNIFTDEEKEEEQENSEDTVPNGSEPYDEPHYEDYLTAPKAVEEPWKAIQATVDDTVILAVEEPNTKLSDEEFKKEMIRQTMSELGKRSAAARRKKTNKNC